jgi:hypothetical protein
MTTISEITINNYFTQTKASFRACKKPLRKPDYQSKSGSQYWYGSNSKGQYVIRESDHWICRTLFNDGKKKKRFIDRECKSIASCQWRIKCKKADNYVPICGKAYLSDFRKIGEQS